MRSLPGQETAQRRLAVPGNVCDPPVPLELHEVEDDGLRLAQVLERDGSDRLVGGDITERDVDVVDLPVLRIDEGIGAELADLAARLSAVFEDERRQGGREIAPHRRVTAELNAF